MSKELFITSSAMAMFIICPRMAGMLNVVARSSRVSLPVMAGLAALLAVPMVLVMVFAYAKLGIWGALGFCILTDVVSAILIANIGMRACVETLIIAAFVLVGVKVAPLISGLVAR